jgi:hypothetical protein
MATSNFSDLPGTRADRVGGPADQARNPEGRFDPVNHQPLAYHRPGILHEHPFEGGPWETPPQQAQERATEAELREALQRAIQSRTAAQDALERAEQAHQRGMEHRAACQRRVASFSDLQGAITESVTEQLRSSRSTKPDLSVYSGRIADKLASEMQLHGAVEAERTFRTELATATTTLQEAERLLRLATDRVLNIHRGHLYSEATRLAELATAHRQVASREQNEWPWDTITEALLLDPMGAALDSFTVPDTPLPPKPVPVAYLPSSGTVTIMNPDGTRGETIDEADFYRMRTAEVRPVVIPSQLDEQQVRERARRGVG